MKKLLVVASFGTTHSDTCEKNIGAIERKIQQDFNDWKVERVFTSSIVKKVLSKQNIHVNNLDECLTNAKDNGIKDVAILPTHLLYGVEYEKLCDQAKAFSQDFDSVKIGVPLLASTEDMLELVKNISNEFPYQKNRCIVLMGHGTYHYVNPVYAALEYMFRENGRSDILVGTVEGYPELENVMKQIESEKYSKVLVTPLMLVSGDHATNDMVENDDSWKNILEQKGLQVDVAMQGLGEIQGIVDIYAKHAKKIIK